MNPHESPAAQWLSLAPHPRPRMLHLLRSSSELERALELARHFKSKSALRGEAPAAGGDGGWGMGRRGVADFGCSWIWCWGRVVGQVMGEPKNMKK